MDTLTPDDAYEYEQLLIEMSWGKMSVSKYQRLLQMQNLASMIILQKCAPRLENN